MKIISLIISAMMLWLSLSYMQDANNIADNTQQVIILVGKSILCCSLCLSMFTVTMVTIIGEHLEEKIDSLGRNS